MSWWTEYHAKWRAKLICELGGQCVYAGCGTTENLELDHIHGRDWKVEKFSSHMRVRRYRVEAAEGKLQVLCRSHNAKKNLRTPLRAEPVPAWVTEEEA
jgi:hypothetical protein